MPLDVTSLEAESRRVADRLRRLAESRLRRRPPDAEQTVADSAHELAVWLAEAAAGLGARPPAGRAVPRLSDFAVGDQVAVTAAELVRAARQEGPAAQPVVDEAVSRLAVLRRWT